METIVSLNMIVPVAIRSTWWRSLLRHWAAGSIQMESWEFFYLLSLSGRTLALGSAQRLTAMSTRWSPWEAQAVGA